MDYRLAEFVRFVSPEEKLADVVEEAKGDTWTKEREHAVLVLVTALGLQFAMVRGGRDGIVLGRDGDNQVYLEVDGSRLKVQQLAWHVHPEPTGPSDHDFAVLEMLQQDSSMLFELRGSPEGTRFRRKGGRST